MLGIILSGIIFFGLKPDDFASTNDVEWLKHQAGIRFKDYGMVHSDPFIESLGTDSFGKRGFSIEIALRPESLNENRFKFIFLIHNGSDTVQLLVGQWRSNIILMNGNDYSWKRRTKRLTFDIASLKTKTNLLTVTSGDSGTKLYCNGELVKTSKDLTLKMPENEKSRVILGNSADGNSPWAGDIYGVAFYSFILTDLNVTRHYKRWTDDNNFLFAANKKPTALYLFDEKEGPQVIDHSGQNQNLKIPPRVPVLEKRFLTAPWTGFKFNTNSVEDVLVNVVGFIPLGFVVIALFVGSAGRVSIQSVIITVTICLTLSLMIEVLQAWIPKRSSSMLDLMMNTLGALTGAFFFKFSFSPASVEPTK